MMPSMDMETTSDVKALTLAATSEQTWPASRQMTCASDMAGQESLVVNNKSPAKVI